jgi:transposase-like protein
VRTHRKSPPSRSRQSAPSSTRTVSSFEAAQPSPSPRLRRKWSEQEKLQIVRESYDQATTVTAVAKKYQVSAVSLYHWRKLFGLNPLVHLDEPKPGKALAVAASPSPLETGSSVLPSRHAQALAERVRERVSKVTAYPHEIEQEEVERRIEALSREIARLKLEVSTNRRHRRFLSEVLRNIGEQIRLVTEVGEHEAATLEELLQDKKPSS